jgi:hypothetical protein
MWTLDFVKRPLFQSLALTFLGYALYAGGTTISYYGDDFQLYFGADPQHPFYYLAHKNPRNPHAYRPLEAVFLAGVQKIFGMDTSPIHLTQISLHILFCCVLLVCMRYQGFSHTQSFLAALYLLVSQANPHAVLSNDTFSQVLGTFSGFVSLYFLSLWLLVKQTSSSFRNKFLYFVSLGFFCLSVFAKETSASFLLLSLGMLLIAKGFMIKHGVVFRRFIMPGVPFIVIYALYLSIRSALGLPGGQFGYDDYDFRVGENVVVNLALLLFQAFLPYSSVETFVAAQTGAYMKLFVTIVSAALVIGAVAYGHWRMQKLSVSLMLCFLMLGSFFPVFLLNHVSELYVYNAMPAVAMLIGTGIGYPIMSPSRSRGTLIACVLGLLLSHVVGVRDKTQLMKTNGDRISKLLKEVRPHLQSVPTNGYLFLVNPSEVRPQYSVFLLPGFEALEKGLSYLYVLAGRSDFTIEILDEAELSGRSLSQAVILTLDGTGSITFWRKPVRGAETSQ